MGREGGRVEGVEGGGIEEIEGGRVEEEGVGQAVPLPLHTRAEELNSMLYPQRGGIFFQVTQGTLCG